MKRKPDGEKTKRTIETAHALGFSGYNKVVHSFAERSEKTGVQRVPELQSALDVASARISPAKAAGGSKRKGQARLFCWVPEALRRELNSSMEYRGYKTVHDYMIMLIVTDAKIIAEEREKAK